MSSKGSINQVTTSVGVITHAEIEGVIRGYILGHTVNWESWIRYPWR